MCIQWFPGHMYRSKKAIQNRLKSIDIVIEVLDARLPASSISPLLANLSQNKAKLKLLNKADLADASVTQKWLDYFNAQADTKALAITSNHTSKNKLIIEQSKNLVPNRRSMDKPLRIMICGVPNVGKSSLINNLLGRKVTKTGNEAGITKDEQHLVLTDDIWLYDTPGMLWEKIIIPESGYRLATAGSVGKNAYNDEEVALHLLDYLKTNYLQKLSSRYKLDNLDINMPSDELLTLLAKKRGTILSKGCIDYQKISEMVIQDFRTGRMGRISLEKPEEWLIWQNSALQREEERNSKKKIKKS
ncbi:MAG: ribosome biogenesis GTPase YlqF [Neisseriaceae bacterium]|nr:MAG: ribosome biogenesis GTPase YlqF [Neisseriaceae bacterium]